MRKAFSLWFLTGVLLGVIILPSYVLLAAEHGGAEVHEHGGTAVNEHGGTAMPAAPAAAKSDSDWLKEAAEVLKTSHPELSTELTRIAGKVK